MVSAFGTPVVGVAGRNGCKRPNGTAAKGRTETLQKAERCVEVSEKMS
jgi:hypothetical protein